LRRVLRADKSQIAVSRAAPDFLYLVHSDREPQGANFDVFMRGK
jgi:hypothetical protein